MLSIIAYAFSENCIINAYNADKKTYLVDNFRSFSNDPKQWNVLQKFDKYTNAL